MPYFTGKEFEGLVSDLLDSNLLNPKGFLSCYTGKEKDFISKHDEEYKLLENFWEKAFMLTFVKPGGFVSSLDTRTTLAKKAYDPDFLFYAFAYLAGEKLEEKVKTQISGTYYVTCTNIQELRDYIFNEVVPKMKTKKFDSYPGYSYGSIVDLDKISFDKEIACDIALIFGNLLKEHKEKKKGKKVTRIR